MLPMMTFKLDTQWINDSENAMCRAAKEQAYYDQCGSDSIIGFYQLIQALSALADRPRTWFRRQPALSSDHPIGERP